MTDILDMTDVLTEWERPRTIKNVTETTVNFEPALAVVERTQDCVVQVAEKEKLNPDTIDWSKEYILAHSKLPIEINEIIYFNDEDFIVIEKGPWRGYGYYEVIAVQTKKPVVEPDTTPYAVRFVQQPTNTVINVAFSPVITAEIVNIAGQRLSVTDNIVLSIATGTGALTGTTTRACVDGLATFTGLSLDTSGIKTLTAASAELVSATSNSFTMAAA